MKPTTYQSAPSATTSKARFALLRVALVVAVFSILSITFISAQTQTSASGASEGKKMERQMWTDFKTKDWTAVESKIAEGFNRFIQTERATAPGRITLIKTSTLESSR
jgi:hypothetical protein